VSRERVTADLIVEEIAFVAALQAAQGSFDSPDF
jgi:hypothetical protein